jgi:hypothetical protein
VINEDPVAACLRQRVTLAIGILVSLAHSPVSDRCHCSFPSWLS